MPVNLGDELIVALAFPPEKATRDSPGSSGFSLGLLASLTGRSTKAVEESLYDLHRAGLITVKVEVKASVVRIVSASVGADGRALAQRRRASVQQLWKERAGSSETGGQFRGRGS